MSIFGFYRRDGKIEEMASLLNHGSYLTRAETYDSSRVRGSGFNCSFAKIGQFVCWIDGSIVGVTGNYATHLIHLYRNSKDIDFLAKLEGDFAGVIFDESEDTLLPFTNRHGTVSLFVLESESSIVWSTEEKGFLSLGVELDLTAVRHFLDLGCQIKDRSWFRGVRMIPAATVVRPRQKWERYWDWPEQEPISVREDGVVEKASSLFREAVEKRSSLPGLGVSLSGGLDSRAIAAAVPQSDFHTITVGQKDSLDRIIARRVAGIKGTKHHEVEIDVENWLDGRIDAVWRTDGAHLLHLHNTPTWEVARKFYDHNLNGAGGGAFFGAGHLFDVGGAAEYATAFYGKCISKDTLEQFVAEASRSPHSHAFYVEHRLRRFTQGGTMLARTSGVDQIFPFLDHDFQDFIVHVPARDRAYLYRSILLREFPEFFKSIPWQRTELPLGYPELLSKIIRRCNRFRGRKRHFTDYPDWIRMDPARSIIGSYWDSPKIQSYTSVDYIRNIWARHLRGEDHSKEITRYLTLEIWLRRVSEVTAKLSASNRIR